MSILTSCLIRPPVLAISKATRPLCSRRSKCLLQSFPAEAGVLVGRARNYSSIPEEMKARRAKVIRDYLSPTPSHLLDVLLSDMILLGRQKKGILRNAEEGNFHSSPPLSKLEERRVLPDGHMLVYFPLQAPASHLAADGADREHVPRGEFARRLWAGGEVRYASSLGKGRLVLDGRAWACREEIEEVEEVERRVDAGAEVGKYVVHLRRRYGVGHFKDEEGRGDEDWDISERRTLVFMRNTNTPPPASKILKHPHPASHSVPFLPTAPHLFHFSALTYNAHAIHIDPLFATSHDAHPSLLVHGPLALSLMLRVLNDVLAQQMQGKEMVRFTYRNFAPLYVDQVGEVKVRRVRDTDGVEVYDVWVENGEGGMAVRGTASVRSRD